MHSQDDENQAFEAVQAPDSDVPAPRPEDSGTPEYPELGEKDGRFYFHKNLDGHGEIPDSVHESNLFELATIARNTGYEVPMNMHPQVDHARQTDQGWRVTYSVAVEVSGTEE